MKWVALFSQTGSEIAGLSNYLGWIPDAIFTNNTDQTTYSESLKMVAQNTTLGVFKPEQINEILPEFFSREHDTIVTLHGYLRILPERVCTMCDVYNGHPALINFYPELKGKDPQERTWENKEKYHLVGSVVHQVIPTVDEGSVLYHESYPSNRVKSKDQLYFTLKSTSLTAWQKFFDDRFAKAIK